MVPVSKTHGSPPSPLRSTPVKQGEQSFLSWPPLALGPTDPDPRGLAPRRQSTDTPAAHNRSQKGSQSPMPHPKDPETHLPHSPRPVRSVLLPTSLEAEGRLVLLFPGKSTGQDSPRTSAWQWCSRLPATLPERHFLTLAQVNTVVRIPNTREGSSRRPKYLGSCNPVQTKMEF